MGTQLGHKVNEKKSEKWVRLLTPSLLPDEELLALLKCNNMRPMTEAIAVTSFRVGGVNGTDGWSVEFPFIDGFTMNSDARRETVLVTVTDPAKVPQGSKTRRPDMLFKMVQKEDHELLTAVVSQAQAAFDPTVYQAAQDQAGSAASAEAAKAGAAALGNADLMAAAQADAMAAKEQAWAEQVGGRRDIAAAAARMAWTFGGKREIRRLHEHLNEGETVRLLAQGTYDEKQGLVALTDQRLLFVFHGLMGQAQEDFPLHLITSVQTSSVLNSGELNVTVSGMRSTIRQVIKDDLEALAAAIRQGMAKAQTPVSPVPAQVAPTPTDPFEQLTKLGQLRDAGLLTDDEFAAKKAEIVARL